MLRSSLLLALTVPAACGQGAEADPPAAVEDPGPKIGVGGSPADWSGPPVTLTLRPTSSDMPGSAAVEVEVPSAGYRLRRDDAVHDGKVFRFDLELEAPPVGEVAAQESQKLRFDGPIPAGVVRVEVWLRRTTHGESPGFSRHELASTAVRSVR